MILGPRYRYWIPSASAIEALRLEALMPGAEVWSWGARAQRARKLGENATRCQWACVEAATHSAWLLDSRIKELGIEVLRVDPVDGGETVASAVDPSLATAWSDYRLPEIRETWSTKAAPYQRFNTAWCATRPWVVDTWRTGSGKTLGGLLGALVHPGGVLVVSPGGARHVWAGEPLYTSSGVRDISRSIGKVAEYTTIEPHAILPEGERSRHYENLDGYMERMSAGHQRPFVCVGAEELPLYVDVLKRHPWSTLVIDEIHAFGSPERWKVDVDVEGHATPSRRATPTGAEKRALAIMDVSQFSSLKLRIGLTGTPLDGGKPRRIWAPLDLLSPGGFGTWGHFANRYCERHKDSNGYWDDRGCAHFEELRARCGFLLYDVPRSVSHAELPPLRVEIERLDAAALLSSLDADEARGAREDAKKWAQAVGRATNSRDAGHARGMQREARAAIAALVKRKYVLAKAVQVCTEGGKVVVFVGRQDLCEDWARRLSASHCGEGWMAHGGGGQLAHVVEAYAQHPGPCWMVGTYQAIGQSYDGMQSSDLGIIAQFPQKVSEWSQTVGRFDRKGSKIVGGKGPLVLVPIACGTQDEENVLALTQQFGNVEEFLTVPELREQGDRLQGLDGDSIVQSILEMERAR